MNEISSRVLQYFVKALPHEPKAKFSFSQIAKDLALTSEQLDHSLEFLEKNLFIRQWVIDKSDYFIVELI